MRILSIARRVLKELFRDKRTLMLMFVAPLLVLSLMKVVFNNNSDITVNLATINMEQPLKETLADTDHINLKTYSKVSNAKEDLKDQKIDGIIKYDGTDFTVTYANLDATKTTLTKSALASAQVKNQISGMATALAKLQQAAGVNPTQNEQPQIHNVYNYGNKDTSYFDKILPILMGFFVFFFVFLISGMALLRERSSGTLDRLLATPVKRSDIVFGYILSYGLLAILQTLIIVSYTIWVLNVEVIGSIWWVVVVNILLAMVALTFGILMSTFAKSEFQMMQFIPLVVVPQIFFSGLVSLDSMAGWLKVIADIMPMKYAGEALTNVVMSGAGFSQIWFDLLILLVFLVLLTIGNILGLKRYRKV
ncbi:multidrug ABC transporter permease [Weissella koreensis KACC 15510]|uniref:ABC transporter permease n=1 Tax=Weissella koreensis TaxID=165096 RepID=UPI0002175886|nr:ABC transporter permease [Weissella koreensis]AEJ22935.1 multidrug ABC transporter permease [Weissella koreensis KACC 15510]